MSDKGKTILILGNGFDLAHGLPTKYSHFLNFCQRVERIWSFGATTGGQMSAGFKSACIDNWETDAAIKDAIVAAFNNRKIKNIPTERMHEVTSGNTELSEIHTLLEDNVWYEYFTELYKANCMKGENWIDFESEIRFIIKEIDQRSLSLTNLWEDVSKEFYAQSTEPRLKVFKGNLKFDKYKQRKQLDANHKITIKDFREKTFEDLEHLTRALELYLAAFVEKIPISKSIPEISNLSPDYVISFNYTDTYQRVYKKAKVYHIHGKADANHSAEDNNMVLGIDEYWTGSEQDERTNFTIFKKFAQRIQKHTGNDSYRYLKEIREIFKTNRNIWSGNVDPLKVHPDGVSYIYVVNGR